MGKPKHGDIQRANMRNGLAFAAPALVGLLTLTAYPIIAAIYYSFCNYTALKPPVWVGGTNYVRLAHDALFYKSLGNTAFFAVLSVPLGVLVAFFLALLLNMRVPGRTFFRTVFYIPSIVPVVAGSVLWLWLLNPQYGLINYALAGLDSGLRWLDGLLAWAHIRVPLGVGQPGWLADPAWAKPALVLMSTWGVGGWVVIYLAGLQDVPKELYEAAEIDGASAWDRVRHITVPFMSPHIFFTVVMGLIGASQYFSQAWVMTGGTGSPANSTLFYSMYLFQNAFQYFKMGYACAMAWVLFILILLATLLIFKTSARHVYYGEGG
jgi:multiple sugar transport system permease protein